MQGVSTLSRSLKVQIRRDAGRYLFPFDCDLADPFAAPEQKRADARWRVLIRLDTDNVSTGMFLKQEDASCENLCRNATYVYLLRTFRDSDSANGVFVEECERCGRTRGTVST